MIDKRLIDKRLLKDKITVKIVAKKDDFGDETYSDPIVVNSVRFDRSTTVSGSRSTKYNNSKVRQKPGVIYIYPSISNVMVEDTWHEAIVNDGKRDYTITGYQPNYIDGEIFSFEVEVI